MKKILINNIFLLSSFLFSQFSDYTETVKFNISTDRKDYRSGENIKIIFDFNIKDEFHIYSSHIDRAPIGGETYTEYYDSLLISNIENIIEPDPITKFDPNFNQKTSYHEGEFQLYQLGQLNNSIPPSDYTIQGTIYATAYTLPISRE